MHYLQYGVIGPDLAIRPAEDGYSSSPDDSTAGQAKREMTHTKHMITRLEDEERHYSTDDFSMLINVIVSLMRSTIFLVNISFIKKCAP